MGHMGEDFNIKRVEDSIEVAENKRKTLSPYNSAKNFKYAKLPAKCDDCVYRSIMDGGNGKCDKYEKGAVCAYRKDFQKIIANLDTRNPEDLKAMLDSIAKKSYENVLMSLFQAQMDGNIPDKNSRAEVNNLLNIVKTINELNDKIVVTEKKEYDKTNDIDSVFRQIKFMGKVEKT